MPNQQLERLTIGSRLARYVLRDYSGKPFDLTSFYGYPFLIFYYIQDNEGKFKEELQHLQAHIHDFKRQGLGLVCISNDEPGVHMKMMSELGTTFPILSDFNCSFAKAIGNANVQKVGAKERVEVNRKLVLIDAMGRLRFEKNLRAPLSTIAPLIKDINSFLPELDKSPVISHAPVLIIPSLLEPKLVNKISREKGLTATTRSLVDYRLMHRVVPQLEHSFGYHATRREDLKFVVLDTENCEKEWFYISNQKELDQHRRFSMQIFLERPILEGGGMCFPEYSLSTYDLPPGYGLVYPSNLMIKETRVCVGKQLRIATHFYQGEDIYKREDRLKKAGGSLNKDDGGSFDDPLF